MAQAITHSLLRTVTSCELCARHSSALRVYTRIARMHTPSAPASSPASVQFCARTMVQSMRGNENGTKMTRLYPPSLNARLYSRERPVVHSTMDEEELQHFSALAAHWWDETGEFEPLHAMNKLRVPFIRDGIQNQQTKASPDVALPLLGMKIVDAGSGGGLLTEPLARLGAFVIGVDPVETSTKIAQLHLSQDPALLPRVKYITGTVEDLVETEEEMFDAVVASEVVEHVADLVTFTESCCRLVKPGGSLFITTMNKTQLAKGLAVFGAEKVLRIVPEGTHDWEKFVPPEELQSLLEKHGFQTCVVHGMCYNPVQREWSWISDNSVNYALHAIKADNN